MAFSEDKKIKEEEKKLKYAFDRSTVLFFTGLCFYMPEQNIKLNHCSTQADVSLGQPGEVS